MLRKYVLSPSLSPTRTEIELQLRCLEQYLTHRDAPVGELDHHHQEFVKLNLTRPVRVEVLNLHSKEHKHEMQ